MAKYAKSKAAKSKATRAKPDPAQMITDELIALIEGGKLPWRKPWRGGAAPAPLRHNGEAYQGINSFMLTLRSNLAGHASPFWMTYLQAKQLGAQVRKGARGSTVVHYGQAGCANRDTETTKRDETGETPKTPESDQASKSSRGGFAYMKHYSVFNADQIDGLDARFHPEPAEMPEHPAHKPIPHMQAFFGAIGGDTCFTGREAKYMPSTDRIYMPEIGLFERPEMFFAVWAHEYCHWTKAPGRLNRSFGYSRFGNTAYAREELVAELGSFALGQHLGFAPAQMETTAAYLQSWLTVLRSDKRAIFTHMADAQAACEYLIKASEAGRAAADAATPQAA